MISDFEARLALARLLSNRSDHLDEAIHEYRILLSERPNDTRLGLELAQLLIRQKKYPEATKQLQTVLDAKPADQNALAALARVYLWTGRNEEAARIFDRLADSGALPLDVRLDMARAYTWQKEYDKATGIYESILKSTRPQHWDIYIELGNVRLYAGQMTQAIDCYKKALAINPSSLAGQKQLALTLHWLARNEEALPLLERLHQSYAQDKEISVALARTYATLGRYAEASSLARGLTDLYPEDGVLLADLADLEARAGHAAKCRQLYIKALGLVDNKEPLLLRYAAQMNLWGDFYRAESIYRSYLAEHPTDFDITIELAWLLVSAQRYEEAEGMYLKLLRQDPQLEKVLLDLAGLKLLEKDFRTSVAYSERLLAISPQNPDGLFRRGEALYNAGRYAEALHVFKILEQVEPRQARGALAVGKTYLRMGSREEADPYLKKAAELAPRSVEALFWMIGQERAVSNDFRAELLEPGAQSSAALVEWAQMYSSLGYNSMAMSCYEQALKQDPDSFPARMGLSEILAVDHEYEKAGEMLESLAEEFPDTSKILITRARVLGWARHYDQSIALYDRVCKLNPSDPVPRKEKARTAAWGKKMDLAVKTYEEAYRNPVDRALTSSMEALTREANDPRLTMLFERLRQTSKSGSIYEGYEVFFQDVAQLVGSLSAGTAARLEEIRLDLFASYRIQKAAFLESRSKWLAWNRKFTRALDSYKNLIDFQPGNQEALFDYAQVECSVGLCDREAATYGHLLAIDPLHLLAGMGLERQRIRSEPSVRLGQSYWDEEGRGGLSRITRYRTDLTVGIPLSCRYHLNVSAHRWLEDPKMKGITYEAYGPTIELNGVLNEYVTGAVSWTNKQYTQSDVSSTNTGFAHLWLNLRDYARLGVGYDRTDELYNNFGIKQSIQADSFWVGASSYLTRDFEVQGKAQYLSFNDGNTGQLYSIEAGYGFTDHPKIVKLTLTGEYRNTDRPSVFQYIGNDLVDITHPYWTPRSYFATAAVLEWYHDISEYLFCGSELHFYDLRLGFGTDTDDNPALRLEGEWHYEFKDHWTAGIKGMLQRSDQWNATGAWAFVKYRF